jgi:hypothetical protein
VRDFFKRKTGEAAGNNAARTTVDDAASRGSKSREADSRSGELRAGARVRHEKYGVGAVLRVEGSGEDAKLTVSFPGYGQKKFIAKYAPLEEIER